MIGVGVSRRPRSAPTGARSARTRERVEELGFSHLLAYDHVLGADPEVHKPWHGPYDIDTTFHEPFVLFGYLAAITSIELVTGIIILPQRQTALVAKQAAEVDLLTDGRFRLGVGLGWNAVEYEALGTDFSDRGRRMGEQVELMRSLWTQRSVTHDGTYEHVTGGRARAAPGAATDPGVVRRRVGTGLPPRRPARRRMVPAGAARPARSTRRARSSRTAARDAGRDPARSAWKGASAGPPTAASTSSSTTSAAGARSARPTSRSTR